MPANKQGQILRAVLIAAVIAAVLGFALHMGGGGGAEEAGDQPLPAPVRVKTADGQTQLSISAQDRADSGIAVAPLKAIAHQKQVSGLATLIAPQALAELERSYQSAAADATRADLAAQAAQREVGRLQPLHQADRLVSDKAFETAQNTATTEEAARKVAAAQLQMQRATLEGQWGPVMARLLAEGGAQLNRLLAGEDLLAQIALPPGESLGTPTMAVIQPGSGAPLNAQIISGAPQTDPKFQGQTFYALLPRDARLQPGMTLPAAVAAGAPVSGVVVPDSAVVRWQGQSWVYLEDKNGSFSRRAVSTATATPEGWLQESGLTTTDQVVVRGAQLLLSEELKAQPGGRSGE